MELLSAVVSIVETLVLGVIVLAALLVVLVIAAALMPRDNPLRQLLAALATPIGVMVGSAVIAIPVEFIPIIDALYDIASLLFIGYSWLNFFREARVLWPRLSEAVTPSAAGQWNSAGAWRADAGARLGAPEEEPRQQGGSAGRHGGEMSRKEAIDYLALSEPLTLGDLTRAHREFLKRNHPDAGGSTYPMQLANIARDVLMQDFR